MNQACVLYLKMSLISLLLFSKCIKWLIKKIKWSVNENLSPYPWCQLLCQHSDFIWNKDDDIHNKKLL